MSSYITPSLFDYDINNIKCIIKPPITTVVVKQLEGPKTNIINNCKNCGSNTISNNKCEHCGTKY